MNAAPDNLAVFEMVLERHATGYSEGEFAGRKWGMTIKRSLDNRRIWLFAEDLAGSDIVSFNLYYLASGRPVLKPCEMSSGKVMDFVLNFHPDQRGTVAELSAERGTASI